MSIFLIGFGSEGVFNYVVSKLSGRPGLHVVDLDQLIYEPDCVVEYSDGKIKISSGARCLALSKEDAIYHRVFIRKERDDRVTMRLSKIYNALVALSLDASAAALFINRPLAGALNASKPAQLAKLKRAGFSIPETTVSLERRALSKFLECYVEVISKGISGIRTRAALFEGCELDALPAHLDVPAMLQRYVPGFDVRLHCIGLSAISLKIETGFTDYRYAERFGYELSFSRCETPPDIVDLCWRYMKNERQEFAGFDFKVHEGKWILLEANPMPGFSYFDAKCGGEIVEALWDQLQRGYSNLPNVRPAEVVVPVERRPSVDVGRMSGA
jgi:hypothetical protein